MAPGRLVRLGVAVITGSLERLLLTYNDHWAAYTFPMTKVRRGDPPEPAADAACRAGTEALGVPVRLLRPAFPEATSKYLLSGRDLTMKHYEYNLYRVEAEPAFSAMVQIR